MEIGDKIQLKEEITDTYLQEFQKTRADFEGIWQVYKAWPNTPEILIEDTKGQSFSILHIVDSNWFNKID